MTVGTLLAGRYRLDHRIAIGGMGEVWRAHDETLDRDVAVKILKPEYAGDPSFQERFRAEARHAAGVSHPGVASVYDYGEADGTSYLVLEFVAGEPLSALLARQGRLAPDDTLGIVVQIAHALGAAHDAGVVHRDVKPGNILVTPSGAVKVTDFGIARAAAAAALTQTGVILGTAHYLSPEQSGGGSVTPASDVYSLGVVTYECLAGCRPYDGDSPVGIALAHRYEDPPPLPDHVPAPLAGLVSRAMAKDPTQRFATAAEFATAAQHLVERPDPGADFAAKPRHLATGIPTAIDPPTRVLPTTLPARRRWSPFGGWMSGALRRVSAAWHSTHSTPRRLTGAGARPTGAGARLTVAGTVAGAVVLVALVAWAFTRPESRSVPDVRGKPAAAAQQMLRGAGFDPVVRHAYDARASRGTVIRQDPVPRTSRREGDDVQITVSNGPQPVALPAGLIGNTYDEVAALLRTRGLVPRPAYVASDASPGTVIGVTPRTDLHAGDTVTVQVAIRGEDEGRRGKGRGKKDDD